MSTTGQAPTAGAGLRWARATALAATAWCTASAAHLAAGGRLPSVPVVVSLIVLTAWPLTLSLRTHASAPRVVALLSASQAGMHVAFVLIGAWTAPAALGSAEMPLSTVRSGHAHRASGTTGMTAGTDPMAATTGSGTPGMPEHAMSIAPSPAMLLAHVCAAVLLGCALASAERVLFSLLSLLVELARPAVRIVDRLLGVLAALLLADALTDTETSTATRSRDDAGPRLPPHLLVRAVGWRGPPRRTAACLIPALPI